MSDEDSVDLLARWKAGDEKAGPPNLRLTRIELQFQTFFFRRTHYRCDSHQDSTMHDFAVCLLLFASQRPSVLTNCAERHDSIGRAPTLAARQIRSDTQLMISKPARSRPALRLHYALAYGIVVTPRRAICSACRRRESRLSVSTQNTIDQRRTFFFWSKK